MKRKPIEYYIEQNGKLTVRGTWENIARMTWYQYAYYGIKDFGHLKYYWTELRSYSNTIKDFILHLLELIIFPILYIPRCFWQIHRARNKTPIHLWKEEKEDYKNARRIKKCNITQSTN